MKGRSSGLSDGSEIFTKDDSERKFPLGKIMITPKVLGVVSKTEVITALGRHADCDWGTVGVEDWQVNDEAVAQNAFILSAYKTGRGSDFWIMTEGDRSVTTILLPEDY